MSIKTYSLLASISLIAASAASHAACSGRLSEEITGTERVVGSLRFDKAAQARVFASDGSEFTAGQTAWMQGQLRGVARSCARGDESAATAKLHDVESVLRVHRRQT